MRRPLLAVMALALSAVNPGMAGEKIHTVRPGESASSIAKTYYGDHGLGLLLLEYNGKPDTTLHPGEALAVPFCEVHIVKRGDSWSRLAQRYLGRASLHRALAVVNDLTPEDPLRLGSRIIIPVALPHVIRLGETLAVLAERTYGDPGRSNLLQLFNGIGDPRRLSVGQTIALPLTHLRLREPPVAESRVAAKLEETPEPSVPEQGAAPAAQQASAQGTAPRYGDRIRAAAEAFEEGNYAQARATLETLRGPVTAPDGGSDLERTELLRLLAFVYVAFDLREEACDSYRSARAGTLDAEEISPKIRDMLADCPE